MLKKTRVYDSLCLRQPSLMIPVMYGNVAVGINPAMPLLCAKLLAIYNNYDLY